MADFTRVPRRFTFAGIALQPPDALAPHKVPFGQNIRSTQEQSVTTRWGLVRQTTSALGAPDPIHSLFRLNDASLYGEIGAPARRFAGADDTLYVGDTVLSAYNAIFTGFSGDPMTAVAATPVNSPRPFLYVADRSAQRKINSSLNDMPFGLETPLDPPTAVLDEIQTTFLETMVAPPWVDYGASTGAATVTRINTLVNEILYDVGTTGMASVNLDDMFGVVPGTTIEIGASPVTVIVQEVIPPVSSTTIGRILYDSGTSGLCTIQPEGSFTVGQIEAPLPDEIRRRYENLNLPIPSRVTVSRTVDFPVNGLVILNSTETVRILSVALGPDGTMSFRCSTAGTFTATQTIDGLSCFRAYFPVTRNAGDPATADAVQNTITPISATTPIVGGIQTPISGGERNWGLVGIEASQPDDIIRVGVRVSAFGFLESVRLLLNVSNDDGYGAADFLHNYYLYEWRKNDLATAIQAAIGAATGLMADAQAEAVTQGQVDAAYSDQYGQEPTIIREGFAPPGSPADRPVSSTRQFTDRRAIRRTDAFVSAGAGSSRQLTLGDEQWVMLQCRIRDLTRVGTDATKTLSNINGAAIVMQFLGSLDDSPIAPITCEFSDAYLTGGYGPDVGATLPPYVYRYRRRSTITGERSNPSPTMRAGMLPHRGRVILTPGATAGGGDVNDWFRYGGALARWQYVGTSENDDSPLVDFLDTMADSEIDGGETLDTQLFQPWPVYDLPRSGTAELAGTAVRWVSGDVFNPDWAADSTIIVNGRATTLYRQPTSTTRLEVVDNCGEGAAVVWSMPEPILLAQPLPAIWGGPINNVFFMFACGDPADPGVLHWTRGNDPDATSPANTLVITSASEPLQNGFFFDGQAYVFSTERLYRIVPTFGDITTFRAVETACTKGLWSRWAFAIAPEGVYFLAKDGIYLTAGGGDAISITTPDLKLLFPQDGAPFIAE